MIVKNRKLADFLAVLEEAKNLPGDDPLSARNRVRLVLSGTIDFLDKVGVPQNLRGPLFGLLTALQDCDRGKAPALFSVFSAGGNPGDGIDASQVKAYAAVSMQLLMERGLKKREAASQVAQKVLSWGPDASDLLNRRRDGANWRMVASWRDAMRKAGGEDDNFGAATYYSMLEWFRNEKMEPNEVNKVTNDILDSGPYWLPAPQTKKSS